MICEFESSFFRQRSKPVWLLLFGLP